MNKTQLKKFRALLAAGHPDRAALLDAAPKACAADAKLHVAVAGADREWARQLIIRTRAKSDLPEALRLAHLIARALDDKAKGGPGRVGPRSFPEIEWPEPFLVPPPWEGGDGKAINDPERKRAAKLDRVHQP